MVSVVEGPGLEGLELGGTEGTPSLQGRAEFPESGMGDAGEVVCGNRVSGWAQTSWGSEGGVQWDCNNQ